MDKPGLIKGLRKVFNPSVFRNIFAFVIFFLVWQSFSTFNIPYLKEAPGPTEVLGSLFEAFFTLRFWYSSAKSVYRVLFGFLIGFATAVPLGLAMGWSRTFKDMTFPVFEVFRPIPPISWIPISILLMPTTELSIIMITFLGAFFCILINTIAGVENIDPNLKRAAMSLGAQPKDVFRYIVLPASLPAIATGAAIGIGLTWECVVAAEMIAGDVGLGYLTWESYVSAAFPLIVVGMLSIGISGYASSSYIRWLSNKFLRWRELF